MARYLPNYQEIVGTFEENLTQLQEVFQNEAGEDGNINADDIQTVLDEFGKVLRFDFSQAMPFYDPQNPISSTYNKEYTIHYFSL